jgi:hypothetical protein
VTGRGLRSVSAVLVGYLIFALSAVALFQLTGRDPHATQPLWFTISAVIYGIVFAGVGGAVAAWIAPQRPWLHAGVVAGILALGATVSLVASAGATWSQWAALVVMAPAAWLGGRLTTGSRGTA